MIKNRTIFTRDNLEVLRGMKDEFVDLIYLDPPFNSNHDYSAPIGSQSEGAEFKDIWGLEDIDLAWHGEIESEHPGLYELLSAARRIHSDSMMAYLIYMSIRIMEMKRVLKMGGGFYLHCDSTASHYLKLVLDEILGRKNFRNEIIWKRTTGRSSGKRFGRVHDVLLYFVRDGDPTWNNVYISLSEKQTAKYSGEDENGKFTLSDVGAPGNNGYFYDLRMGEKTPLRGYRMPEAEARRMIDEGTLVIRLGKTPRRKRYLHESKGEKVNDVIVDIPPVNSQADERTGYPTQKPLLLLERIIKASSNPKDMILDPFCGCATTCVAAEKLDRQWIGIDISVKAAELVKERIEEELGLLLFRLNHRTDVPTDREEKKSKDVKHTLYGKQEGNCNGCKHHFRLRNLTLDHIVPRSKGGGDTDSNLQLLCGACNSVKGDRPQEYLLAYLARNNMGENVA